ncbi:SCAN domain-containing protein 3 [Trichonephila clavipes]|nr:SCAN domain-containing protein 3 [Trichonephila clavipes]
MNFHAFFLLTRNENHLTRKYFLSLNEIFEKVSVLFNCPTALSEKFIAIDDDNVCTTPLTADKDDILEFVHSSKNIIDAHSDDENEMNNAAPVPTSSEMRNIMKSMRSYLDTHSSGEMNNKMDNLMLKKQFKEKSERVLQ